MAIYFIVLHIGCLGTVIHQQQRPGNIICPVEEKIHQND